MAIIRHFEAEAQERAAYLKQRRLMAGAPDDEVEADEDEDVVAEGQLSPDRYAEMSAAEDLILTITASGSGQLNNVPLSVSRWKCGLSRRNDSPK